MLSLRTVMPCFGRDLVSVGKVLDFIGPLGCLGCLIDQIQVPYVLSDGTAELMPKDLKHLIILERHSVIFCGCPYIETTAAKLLRDSLRHMHIHVEGHCHL